MMEADDLGLKNFPGKITMDLVKVSRVTNCSTLQNIKNINQFLGFCNFYQRFVEDYSTLS